MRLSKREIEYIKPAFLYSWQIYVSAYRKTALWDDDPLVPVKVGAVADGLIRKGVLELVHMGYSRSVIRLSKLGETFRCPKCVNGRTFEGSENPDETVECKHCVSGIRIDNGKN
ncbi:hypothetical protein Dpoa569_0001275 [Dickeya poaceiphila]|uniref:Uncharacterized protein n=1 Tax=Dickeya poaceiphila TaxID=568768 RepID=A0A5B8IAK8_9GAMM|nr:hypothetical protein Dpoa569_0001275 [Dickeya poaceiphila]